MTELHWHTIRQQAIAGFGGDTPLPQTEQDILDAFEQNPQIVLREIDRITQQIANGKPINSGWAVLRSNVTKATSSALPDRVVQLSASADKNDRTRKAEQRIMNTLIHYDRWDEDARHELFDHAGLLHEWDGDQALENKMRALWEHHRPRAVASEFERDAWYQRHREHVAAVADAKRREKATEKATA